VKKIVLLLVMVLTLAFALSYGVFAQLNDADTDTSNSENGLVPQDDNMPTSLSGDGEIVVLLNGSPVVFDVKPYVAEGTTLVPVRAIFEALGATVEWDEKAKTVISRMADKTVKLSIDSKIMYVNDKAVALTYPAVIMNGRTLVPVRAISESFGCIVGWDGKFLQVSIISDTYNYCMLYAVDERAKSFHRDLVPAQLTVGWYESPVQMLYAPGKSKVFKKSEVSAQLKVGWYEEPLVLLYAPGKSKYFPQSNVAAQLEAGWCDEPLVLLYALGKSKYFPQSKVATLLEAGWYEKPSKPIKICIDAGHYASWNRSAVYPSYSESVMTWELHLLLKEELEAYGFEVITTRSNKNVDLPLEERGKKSQGCDLFISLHSNACSDTSVDEAVIIPFQDLSWTDIDDKSRAIGEKLGACIKDVMQLSNYKIYICIDEEDRDENGLLDDEYYSVLHGARNVGTPGVILEHGFHTNIRCAKWLSERSNLEILAKAEAKVIAEFFGVKKVTE